MSSIDEDVVLKAAMQERIDALQDVLEATKEKATLSFERANKAEEECEMLKKIINYIIGEGRY